MFTNSDSTYNRGATRVNGQDDFAIQSITIENPVNIGPIAKVANNTLFTQKYIDLLPGLGQQDMFTFVYQTELAGTNKGPGKFSMTFNFLGDDITYLAKFIPYLKLRQAGYVTPLPADQFLTDPTGGAQLSLQQPAGTGTRGSVWNFIYTYTQTAQNWPDKTLIPPTSCFVFGLNFIDSGSANTGGRLVLNHLQVPVL